MSEYLFAYGTLQPGCAPGTMAAAVAKLRSIGEGFVHGVLYNLGGYPGAVPDPNSTSRIYGTVMELPEDESVLRKFDTYEGFDPRSPESSEYVRELQMVEMAAGGVMECWFYRYNWKPDASRATASGMWGKDRGQ
jgi:gamma-glutamylcyclotransferase (GGCT)/AIG2-like uncharacterized protein YtfP